MPSRPWCFSLRSVLPKRRDRRSTPGSVGPVCPGSDRDCCRVVEDVPTLLAIGRMDVPRAGGRTGPAPRSGSATATPRIASATKSQAHRDSQWRGIGNSNWTVVNCRASGIPAAGRSRIDSSSCRKGVRGKMGAKGSSRKNDPGRAHQMAQARRTIDPW